jgi:Tfp pilus assembly protein PilO
VDKLKQWVALTVLLVLVILAGGWFLLVSPKKSEADEIKAQVATQQTANSALRTQLSVLRSQAKALPREQAKLAAVAAKIPDNPALPALIRALTRAADESGVELSTLAPTPPAVVAVPEVAAATPSPGATRAPSTTVAASGTSAGQLQSIGVNVTVYGGFFQVEQFLDRLESLTRAMKVTAVTMSPGKSPTKPGTAVTVNNGVLGANIVGTVYMAAGRITTPNAPTTGK